MKKKIPLIILAIACIVAGLFLSIDTHNENTYTQCVTVSTPERPSGQQNVIGFSFPPIET